MSDRLLCVFATLMFVSLSVNPMQAATIVYTSDAAFLSAAGGGLSSEGFETAVLGTPTSVTFPGGTFGCAGGSYCPSFFGISGSFADAGSQSVYFATPDSATFTFDSAITAFGVAIGGAGDVGAITLLADLSNGDSVNALTAYTGPGFVFGENRQFFGVIDTVPFTSITFTGSNSDDGVFFDTMYYGTAAPTGIPEPSSFLLAGIGLAGAGLWRRYKVK
jgi:hypothetical protein